MRALGGRQTAQTSLPCQVLPPLRGRLRRELSSPCHSLYRFPPEARPMPSNESWFQRRGPRREMVTHSGCGNVAGHVRCKRELDAAETPRSWFLAHDNTKRSDPLAEG